MTDRERRSDDEGMNEDFQGVVRRYGVFVAYAFAFLAVAILTGVQDDYGDYIVQWGDVFAGRDPWLLGRETPGLLYNAYGPLFNVLALLTLIYPLMPKLLFATSYIAFVGWLLKRHGPTLPVIFAALSPLPWIQVAFGGFFDAVVSLSCVVALECRTRNRDSAAGIWLATGILLKYMPLIVLPFLAFGEGKSRARLLMTCAGVVAVGMTASVLAWGTSTFNPLVFAATRLSQDSIYEAAWHVTNVLGHATDFTGIATPALAAAGLAIFAWCMVYKVESSLSALMAVLVTVAFYRTGYEEYQMMPFTLAVYWAAANWEAVKADRRVLVALVLNLTFVSFMDVRVHLFNLESNFVYQSFVITRFLSVCGLLLALMRLSVKCDESLRQPSNGPAAEDMGNLD